MVKDLKKIKGESFILFECLKIKGCFLTRRACGLRFRRANLFNEVGCYIQTSNSVERVNSFEKCMGCPVGEVNFGNLSPKEKRIPVNQHRIKKGFKKKYDFTEYALKHGFETEGELFYDLFRIQRLSYSQAAKRLGCPRHIIAARVREYGVGIGRH